MFGVICNFWEVVKPNLYCLISKSKLLEKNQYLLPLMKENLNVHKRWANEGY